MIVVITDRNDDVALGTQTLPLKTRPAESVDQFIDAGRHSIKPPFLAILDAADPLGDVRVIRRVPAGIDTFSAVPCHKRIESVGGGAK